VELDAERQPDHRMIVGDLTTDEQETVRQVLDGMRRTRVDGTSPAVLSARLDIGIGTK
jgi:hypothetical protein